MPKPEQPAEESFAEIAKREGEEAAINAGIAADPDAFELDDEWFSRARPVAEVDPHDAGKLEPLASSRS